MTKPGFIEKRIELVIEEEVKKYDSEVQSSAFREGIEFVLKNRGLFLPKPFGAYVATGRGSSRPIMTAFTDTDMRTALDEYCGVDINQGKFISYTAHNPKYPSDYEGYFTYECDGELEYFDIHCVDFK